MSWKVFAAALAIVLNSAGVWAQTTPTGSITGQVVDAQGAVLPGVTVSVTSAALQGTRTAITSGNGDYIIPATSTAPYRSRLARPIRVRNGRASGRSCSPARWLMKACS